MTLFQELVLGNGFSAKNGYEATKKVLALPSTPTALLVSANIIMVGVLEAIFEMGLLIPDDLSIIGFMDMSFAPYFATPLTTISMPVEQIGKHALQLLLQRINSTTRKPHETIILPGKFSIRESTHKPLGS